MFLILDAMVRMIAPILAFTSDEVWQAMPHTSADDAENVVFNQMPKAYNDYALGTDELALWDKLIVVRSGINAALETARANKLVGKPLEAAVTLLCSDENAYNAYKPFEQLLAELCIVSYLHIEMGEGGTPCEGVENLSVKVERAQGEKCERCWIYSDSVGHDTEHPTLCARCAKVVRSL